MLPPQAIVSACRVEVLTVFIRSKFLVMDHNQYTFMFMYHMAVALIQYFFYFYFFINIFLLKQYLLSNVTISILAGFVLR